MLDRVRFRDGLDEYRLTPRELRARLAEKEADVVFAFQVGPRIIRNLNLNLESSAKFKKKTIFAAAQPDPQRPRAADARDAGDAAEDAPEPGAAAAPARRMDEGEGRLRWPCGGRGVTVACR